MDVLPPELWGEICVYAFDEIYRGYNYRGYDSATLSPLICREFGRKRRRTVVRLDGSGNCKRLRLLQQLPCDITLMITREAAAFCELVRDLESIEDLRPLTPPRWLDTGSIEEFANLDGITLYYCNVSDVGALRHVSHISLQWCSMLADISQLGGQQSVRISGCLITDVRSLADVPDVTLQSCPQLSDVSCLGRQKKLALLECRNITDISTLTRVPHLHIRNAGVTALPPMENTHLCVAACPRLTDISRLGAVGTLRINCYSTTPTPGRPFLYSPAHPLAGTHALAGCPKIVLNFIDISDLRPLRGAKSVDLLDCPNVRDLSPLDGCPRVRLHRCEGVTDVSPLRHAREVCLDSCTSVTDVSSLGGVWSLSLSCGGLAGLPPLPGHGGRALGLRSYVRQGHHRLYAVVDTNEDREAVLAAHPHVRHRKVTVFGG